MKIVNNTYSGSITHLKENQIFVFGSNTEGRHGKGAALLALQKFGAVYGNPQGFQGKSYAIITKDLTKKRHPSIKKEDIIYQIYTLYRYAYDMPDREFLISYSGTKRNLNGYSNQEMADMFSDVKFNIPDNIVFEEEFSKLLNHEGLNSL